MQSLNLIFLNLYTTDVNLLFSILFWSLLDWLKSYTTTHRSISNLFRMPGRVKVEKAKKHLRMFSKINSDNSVCQSSLSKNHLKESDRRNGNDSLKWRQYGNAFAMLFLFPPLSSYGQLQLQNSSLKYLQLLNYENNTEYRFNITWLSLAAKQGFTCCSRC